MSMAQFGNDLYSGKRSYDFVGQWKKWLAIGGLLMALSALLIAVKGFNPGIEFRGGTEFDVPNVAQTTQSLAVDATHKTLGGEIEPRVSVVGEKSVRVQTPTLSETDSAKLRNALAQAYNVKADSVTSSFVGASWGDDVTKQALKGLAVFLVLVVALITLYFRAWEMAAGAFLALCHDLLITAGVYSLVGFEVTPAAVIGFLTILGYSLYDTVVVFDKVRENTRGAMRGSEQTFAEASNLAINQTLVRSINTSIVALLPVAAILFIGAFLLGAGTLKDISLALFVGTLVGTFSSIFIATPLFVALRRRNSAVRAQEQRVRRSRSGEAPATRATARVTAQAGSGADVVGEAIGGSTRLSKD